MDSTWLVRLDRTLSSYSILAPLDDPAAPVRAAARGLKTLRRRAAGATSRLVELLQDSDEAVRAAAGEAVAAAGPLDDDSTIRLAKGLSSPDNVVRAQVRLAVFSG